MKLLRTIRLDPSDALVFDRAAEPGEWAISGSFLFGGVDPAMLPGKARVAFRTGLLGIQSFGWSTFAQIVEVTETDRRIMVEILVNQFCEHLGAPDLASASAAAEEEVAFAASLCAHPKDTLIAVQRSFENGAIRESFRALTRNEGGSPMRVFSFAEVEGEEEPGEGINLVDLATGKRSGSAAQE